jgi:CRP/FNR family cyclic AMP-dependent transcriptional regulator
VALPGTLASASGRRLPSRNGWTCAGWQRSGAVLRGRSSFTVGDLSGAVLIILGGSVKMITINVGGHERLPTVRGCSEIIGEVSAVWQVPRSATVQPIDPVEILSIPCSAFVRTLRKFSAAAMELIRVMGDLCRHADHAWTEFGGSTVPQRVATVFVELAMHYPTADGAIGLPLAQDELASLAATSRSTLAALRDRRIVLTAPQTDHLSRSRLAKPTPVRSPRLESLPHESV